MRLVGPACSLSSAAGRHSVQYNLPRHCMSKPVKSRTASVHSCLLTPPKHTHPWICPQARCLHPALHCMGRMWQSTNRYNKLPLHRDTRSSHSCGCNPGCRSRYACRVLALHFGKSKKGGGGRAGGGGVRKKQRKEHGGKRVKRKRKPEKERKKEETKAEWASPLPEMKTCILLRLPPLSPKCRHAYRLSPLSLSRLKWTRAYHR